MNRAGHRGIRSRTRRAALQALYQWQMTGHSAEELHAQFREDPPPGGFDPAFFDALVGGVIIDFETLDAEIAAFADRPVAEIDPVERAILRMGAHELRSMADIPWRTAIDEAVELARTFGAEQSHKYVNGVLDRVARRLRPD